MGMVFHTVISALKRLRQEGHKFKTSQFGLHKLTLSKTIITKWWWQQSNEDMEGHIGSSLVGHWKDYDWLWLLKQFWAEEGLGLPYVLFIYLFLGGTGNWTHAKHIGTLPLEPWPSALFALVTFEIRSHVYAQAGLYHDWSSYVCFLHSSDNRNILPIQLFSYYWLRWNLMNLLPGMASNHNPPNLCLPSS
jgi:hypothetical protein